MKYFIIALLLLVAYSAHSQEVDITELDQIFVDNIDEIELDENDSNTNIQWTKENTASTFISMREKMKTNKVRALYILKKENPEKSSKKYRNLFKYLGMLRL